MVWRELAARVSGFFGQESRPDFELAAPTDLDAAARAHSARTALGSRRRSR